MNTAANYWSELSMARFNFASNETDSIDESVDYGLADGDDASATYRSCEGSPTSSVGFDSYMSPTTYYSHDEHLFEAECVGTAV